jgi:Anti-sigma-28 factor, FlgM
MNSSRTDARLAELKRRVAMGEYAVDASLVADEILEKMRLVRTVRPQLVEASEAGRTPGARSRSHRRGEARRQRHESRAPARYAA